MNAEDAAVRNMRDFLTIFNKMAETCFYHCVNNLNCRELTPDESLCVEKCAAKSININHKMMQVYMEVQPEIINKRIEEAEKLAEKQHSVTQDVTHNSEETSLQ